MLFIGPNDLSLALGFPPSIPHATNPKVQEVIAEILKATLKAGKLVRSPTTLFGPSRLCRRVFLSPFWSPATDLELKLTQNTSLLKS